MKMEGEDKREGRNENEGGREEGRKRGRDKEDGGKQKDPADIVSRVLEERQLPTLPPGGAVPSAMAGLTSLFGMGRGGSPPL